MNSKTMSAICLLFTWNRSASVQLVEFGSCDVFSSSTWLAKKNAEVLAYHVTDALAAV